MADVNDFYGLGDLATFNQAVQQSDPYGLVARQLNSWTPDASTWSPMATGATSFGKAFLAGMLGNYARQNAADQMNAVVGVLPQLKANPMAVAAPEGVDADAFSVLKGNAILRNYAAQAQEAEANKKFNLDILAKFLGKKVEVLGENEAYDQMGQGGMNPNSPAYKVEQDQKKQQLDIDSKLTNSRDFLRVSGAPYVEARANLDLMLENFNDTSPMVDLTYAIAANKILDPSSIAREAEVENIKDIVPLLERKIKGFKNYVTPEGTITKEGKLAIMKAVDPKMKAMGDQYKNLLDIESKRLAFLGADPTLLAASPYRPYDLQAFSVPTLNQETYNQLRAQGLTKEQIKAQYGM